jgi:hypothetical protein
VPDAPDLRTAAAELEAIVRDLALSDPLSTKGEPIHGYWNVCELCGRSNDVDGVPIDHRDSCPWHRAREWMKRKPTVSLDEVIADLGITQDEIDAADD